MSDRRCHRCGDTAAEHTPEEVLGWSSTVESGVERSLCPPCTRAHVRDIETKLDEAWWSDDA